MASHRWTGAAEPAARLAAGESELGHEVLFALTPGSSFEDNAVKLGVNVTGEVAFDRTNFPWRRFEDIRRLRALIRRFRPDIVHAHLTHDHIFAAIAIGRPRPNGPALFRTFHREGSARGGTFERLFLMPRTVGAISISKTTGDQIRQNFDWDDEKIAVIGGVIETDRFRPTDRGARMRDLWGVPQGAPVAGIVSRIRVARGFEWLLEAAEIALPKFPDARIVICGRGNWKRELGRRMSTHPCSDQLVYGKYVMGEDLEDAYNAFDVSMLLRPGNDGTCRAALEAMASGCPVIGGDIGAMRDLLSGTEAGWLVPDFDREALAAILVEALSNPDECRRRGKNARELILRHHREELLAPRVVAFYEKVLHRSRGESLTAGQTAHKE